MSALCWVRVGLILLHFVFKVQQLNPISPSPSWANPAPPASPPHPLLSPHNAWDQVLPDLPPLHFSSWWPQTGPSWADQTYGHWLPLGSQCPCVIRVSVTSLMGTGGFCVPTGGCKVLVSTESAHEVQSSSGSTARAVALSEWQQRSALPVAPTQ